MERVMLELQNKFYKKLYIRTDVENHHRHMNLSIGKFQSDAWLLSMLACK
jgi:hypothetical protein